MTPMNWKTTLSRSWLGSEPRASASGCPAPPDAAVGLPKALWGRLAACGGLSTRLFFFALLSPALPAQTTIAIVTTSDVEAYAEALDGLKSGLAGVSAEIRVFQLEKKGGKLSLPATFQAPQHGLVVAMGMEAALALSQIPIDAAVLATMILRADAESAKARRNKTLATIVLDVPIDALAVRLKEIFPGKTRLGIVFNPDWPGLSSAGLQAQAKQHGITALVAACSRAQDLLAAFLSFKGKADFVWCLPDSSLYDSVTVQAVLLASLNNRLPIIGFSSSFVRAGALMGVYPDFREVGTQTAEAVRNYLAGRTLPVLESPRVFRVAVNQRVERLLGLEPSISKEVALFR
jgi:putative ABC transport system substrate-binding protein